MNQFFAIIASTLAIVTYLRYYFQIKEGLSKPNPATIFIWFGVGIMNAVTYFLSVKDLWQTLIIITSTFFLFLILFYSLIKRKFTKLKRFEIAIILFVIVIGLIWKITGDSKIANALLQIIYVISYIPVAISVMVDEVNENPVAWIIAVIAYVFATLSVVCNYTGEIVSLIYPVVSGILGNGVIVILIFRNRKNSLIN